MYHNRTNGFYYATKQPTQALIARLALVFGLRFTLSFCHFLLILLIRTQFNRLHLRIIRFQYLFIFILYLTILGIRNLISPLLNLPLFMQAFLRFIYKTKTYKTIIQLVFYCPRYHYIAFTIPQRIRFLTFLTATQ